MAENYFCSKGGGLEDGEILIDRRRGEIPKKVGTFPRGGAAHQTPRTGACATNTPTHAQIHHKYASNTPLCSTYVSCHKYTHI